MRAEGPQTTAGIKFKKGHSVLGSTALLWNIHASAPLGAQFDSNLTEIWFNLTWGEKRPRHRRFPTSLPRQPLTIPRGTAIPLYHVSLPVLQNTQTSPLPPKKKTHCHLKFSLLSGLFFPPPSSLCTQVQSDSRRLIPDAPHISHHMCPHLANLCVSPTLSLQSAALKMQLPAIWHQTTSLPSVFLFVALVMSTKRGRDARELGASASEDSSPTRVLSDAEVQAFFQHTSSDSADDLCGPHGNCCGGAVCNGVYTSCVKRLGKGGFQHARGQVCRSKHKYFQCASCQNVAHLGCWVRTAKGFFVLPSALMPFHCYTCECKKDQQQPLALPGVADENKKESVISPEDPCISHVHSSENTAEPCNAQPSENKRIFMSEKELRKYCKEHYWKCWNSAKTRIYYRCKRATCDVTFHAKKCPDADDTWFVPNMPTCHSCSSATPQVLTSLVTLKDNLSEALVKEIERLGVTKSFRSKQIQHHIFEQEKVLVDTKLIHNIVYRVRQKLFGQEGDMIYLLEQQKVA